MKDSKNISFMLHCKEKFYKMQLLFLVLFLFVAHTLAVPWVGQARKEAFWVARHNDLIAQTNAHRADVKVVFFGDSITEKWNLQGLPIWNTYYAPRHSYNYGIGGDKVEHLIYRLANHELDGINPKIVVLEIGIYFFRKFFFILISFRIR